MRSSASLIGLLLLAAGPAAGTERARVTVASEANVDGEVVHLRDVALLIGGPAQALGDLSLGPAPQPGESRTLDGTGVLEKLRRGGLDPAQVTYSIPPALRVRRASQEVTEAQVRRAIEEFLGAALGAGAGDAQVRAVELAGPVRLPLGRWQARVTVPPGVPVMGRTRLQIEFSIADRPVQSTWVTADIARFAPVVVVKRAVARGELLTADDVLVDRRDLSQVPRDVVTDPLDGAGRAARVPLLAYAPLRRSEIEAVAAVRRGDVVLLIAEGDGMRITAPGEVREDARQGDPVRVVNRMSRKEVVGHVVDAATVAVDF